MKKNSIKEKSMKNHIEKTDEKYDNIHSIFVSRKGVSKIGISGLKNLIIVEKITKFNDIEGIVLYKHQAINSSHIIDRAYNLKKITVIK